MSNKLVPVTTMGFMCLGMMSVLGSLGDLGLASPGGSLAGATGFALGCLVLGVCAILSLFYGRTIDTLIFSGGVAFALTMHNVAARDTHLTAGWFFLLWTVFFFYVWLSSFRSGWARWLNLLSVWMAMLGFCLLYWTRIELFGVINGCAGLIAGVTALYISAAESLNHGWSKIVLPTGGTEIP